MNCGTHPSTCSSREAAAAEWSRRSPRSTAGIEPLIVEKQALVGGSTGMSGGMVWLPNNPLMRADGIADSHEDGLAYLADVVGDIGAASSPARRETFLTAGYEMINFLLRKGVRLHAVSRLERLLPESQGRQRRRPRCRGYPVRRRTTRELARQGPAAARQELRVRHEDQRAALGAVLQPGAASFRRRHPGIRCAPRRRGCVVASSSPTARR